MIKEKLLDSLIFTCEKMEVNVLDDGRRHSHLLGTRLLGCNKWKWQSNWIYPTVFLVDCEDAIEPLVSIPIE